MTRTAFRTCPLCEAICGLELTIEDEQIVRVRGDREHVLSEGFLCPKGAALGQLVHDPHRLRRPVVRRDGQWLEVGWDEALSLVHAGLRDVRDAHGNDGVAVYLGNPTGHTPAGGFGLRPFLKSLDTRNRYSAATVDQMPMHLACGFLLGDPNTFPVPDLDRTHLLVVLGANPLESNGSLCTAPNFGQRLRNLQARGGRLVVVDPRRTKTAAMADQHVAVVPGTDALLLLALVHVLFEEGLTSIGVPVSGVDELRSLVAPFAPAVVGSTCGVDATSIRALAQQIAAAPSAAVYGRMGVSTTRHGTLCNWLILAINVLTGNFDRPGGLMFALAPDAPMPRTGVRGAAFATGRWTSRVRGLPEVNGELPVATLADEIEEPGPGQVRALVTIAGNPILSTPNSARLDRALATLDFMVSVDPYLNETTRHAHVILPPMDLARGPHFDRAFPSMSVRNLAVYSPPSLPPDPGAMDELDILARLTAPDRQPADFHEAALMHRLERAVADPTSRVHGRCVDELRAGVVGTLPVERLIDVQIRLGPYGDAFGAVPGGIGLRDLLANPHGIDLGPLQPRLDEVLRTPSGTVELCPPALAASVRQVDVTATPRRADRLVLIGRRTLRSNNSWMHNLPALVRGRHRCTLLVHPDDARRYRLIDGGLARVSTPSGSITAPVEVSDEVRVGVVSLPHGWGHDSPGTRLPVAAERPGVNVNLLTDEHELDPVSGNAILSGIEVQVSPA